LQRKHTLNYAELNWQPQQLSHLDLPFSEQEVESVIKAMPKQKAPGPDDFIGALFSQCWSIIKADCMDDVQQFYSKNQHGLYFLNQALVVLIPKKPNVEKIIEFRPIHSSAKLISKILANRLATELKKIISYSQNAFIKK
jgi:hypothetical protein